MPTATAVATAVQSDPPRLGTHRTLALAAGGLAVAGTVVGSALGAVAKSKWEAADPRCDAQHACDPVGLRWGQEARDIAHGSTAAFVVAALGAAGGVALWLTAPDAPAAKPNAMARMAPWFGRDSGGLVWSGSF